MITNDKINLIIENRQTSNYLKLIIDENIKRGVNLKPIKSPVTPLFYEKEQIARIQNMYCIVNDSMNENNMKTFFEDFIELLKRDICIEKFYFGLNTQNDWKLSNSNYILQEVNSGVKRIYLQNISLKSIKEDYFKSKRNLEKILLNGCIDIDLKSLTNLKPTVNLEFKNCDEFIKNKDFLEWAIKSLNPIKTDNKDIDTLINLFKPNKLHDLKQNIHKINILSFANNIEFISDNLEYVFKEQENMISNNLYKNFDLYIDVNKELDFNSLSNINNYGNKILSLAKKYNKNMFLMGTPTEVSKLFDTTLKFAKTMLTIDKINDISFSKLKKLNCEYIALNTRYGDGFQKTYYSINDMKKIKKRINQIERKVQPFYLKNVSQKELFTRLYLELGKTIDYDEELAIDIKNGMQPKRAFGSQNLKNGLLINKTLCAGLSDIIEKICTDFHIEADIISTVGKNPHAWNRVKLDGKYYFVDLTWDLNDIKQKKYPLNNFLKSVDDFKKDGHKCYVNNPTCFDMGFDITNSQCYTTINDTKQLKLINNTSFRTNIINKFKNEAKINKENIDIEK